MRGHVAKKGNNYYAVVYEGIDPSSGKERHRWHAAGPRRIDAERLVNELVKRRHNGETTTSDRTTLAEYLTERWLPLQQSRLRPKTYRSYKSVVDLHIVPRIGRIRLGKLQAAGFRGPIGLQCYAVKGDKLENLRQSIKAWKEYSARLADGCGGK